MTEVAEKHCRSCRCFAPKKKRSGLKRDAADTITDLRTALEFYRDNVYNDAYLRDKGQRARQALTRIHEPSNEEG